MKKALALILSALMLASLTACSGGKASSTGTSSKADTGSAASAAPSQAEETKITYPLEGGKTLSLAWKEMAAVTAGGTDWKHTPFITNLEKNTGVTLEISHPTEWATVWASSNLPDMMYDPWNADYNGGAAKAISDGVITAVDDYMDQYAPDYKAFITSNDTWRKQATTPDGKFYGFNFVRTSEKLQTSAGLIIRQDWMDDLKLDMPETPEELKNVLVAFRDQKNASAPFEIGLDSLVWWDSFGLIAGGFGLPSTNFYLGSDGKVHYGAYEENYKDYIAYMSDLYAENLLDKNVTTVDGATVNANMLNGESGLSEGSSGSGIGNWMTSAEKNGDTTFKLTGLRPLSQKKGEKPVGGQYDNPINGYAVAISGKCKDVETACKFLNYGYTDEGSVYWNFGTEGVSWNKANEEHFTHKYTDVVMKNDKLSLQQGLAQYCMAWDGGPFGQSEEYIWQYLSRPEQHNALLQWTDTDAAKYKLPSLTIAEDKLDEYSSIGSEIGTYISENFSLFITGKRSLSEYEDFHKTLKDMGMETYIQIMQEAYDAYLAK